MRIIARGTLRVFWAANPDGDQPLKSWFREAEAADWETPHDVKDQYGTASVIGDSRIVFNIAGNKYRLVSVIKYRWQIVYIRHILTHAEYDKGRWKL